MGKMKQKEEEIRKREAQKAKELLAESSKTRNVRKAIEERGVRMGECVYGGMVSQSSREAFLDGEGNIHWPLLVIYNEFDQSDYFQDVHEGGIILDILKMLFDPTSPPPDWDPSRRYRHDTVSVYIATHQSKELKSGKKAKSDEDFISSLLGGSERKGMEEEYDRADKSTFVKLDLNSSLAEVLLIEGHVVGGFPVLFIVEADSVYERHMLAKGPEALDRTA